MVSLQPYGYLIAWWALFGITHSVFAATWWKRRVQSLLGNYYPYYRLSYSLFAFGLLAFIILFELRIPAVWLWYPTLAGQLIAGIPAIGGILIMAYCIRKYFYYLSGIDVLVPAKRSQGGLETGGLHRYVRHPLYFGTLLTVWSCWFIWPELAYGITCAMITLYTIIGTVWEERKLRQEYGTVYKAYQQRVPMLWPLRLINYK